MATNKFKTKHLGIYRNEAGDKFYCNYMLHGKLKWESGFRSEQAAINARARSVQKKQIEEEEFPRNKLGWFIKHQYYPYHLNEEYLTISTVLTTRSQINKWILPYLGNKVMQAIDFVMLNEWRQHVKEDGIPDYSYQKVDGFLKHILGKARDFGVIQSNPATKLMRIKYVKQEIRALTVDEVKRLLVGCNPYDKAIISVGVLSGLRIAELFGLMWTPDIDFEEGTLTVTRQRNVHNVGTRGYTTDLLKTPNSRRTQVMMEELIRVLLAWREFLFDYEKMKEVFPALPPYYKAHHPEWVFPSVVIYGVHHGFTPRSQRSWRNREFEEIRQRNGFTDITFHALRHTHKMLKR